MCTVAMDLYGVVRESVFDTLDPPEKTLEDIERERRERLARALEGADHRDATVVSIGDKLPVANPVTRVPKSPETVYKLTIHAGRNSLTEEFTAAQLYQVPYFRTLIDNSAFAENASRTVDVSIDGACTDAVAQYFAWLKIRGNSRKVASAFKTLYDPSVMLIAHYFNDAIFLGPTVIVSPGDNAVKATAGGKTVEFAVRPDIYTEGAVLSTIIHGIYKYTGVNITFEIEETLKGGVYRVEGATLSIFNRGTKRLDYMLPRYDNALVPKTFPAGYPEDYVETLISDYMDWAAAQGSRWHCRLSAFMQTINVANAAWTEGNRGAISTYFGAPAKVACELEKMDTERAAQYVQGVCRRHPKEVVEAQLTRNPEYARVAAEVTASREYLRRVRRLVGSSPAFRDLKIRAELDLEQHERNLDILTDRILKRR